MDLRLPTAYFPPVSYVAKAFSAGTIIIEQYETYPKQTIRNHCDIVGPNGKQRLTVPVSKPDGNRTITKDIRIDNAFPWQRLHLRSLETAYNNSPFHLYYKDHFEPVFNRNYVFLLDLNIEIFRIISTIFRIKKEILLSEEYERSSHPFFLKKDGFLPDSPIPSYVQVFMERFGFLPDMSILDLIFNLGPESGEYLNKIP